VLGLGVGYPQQAASVGQEFGSPLATMRDYLEQMAAPGQLPAPDAAYPRIIAANGPKMLALAGEITDGAMPPWCGPTSPRRPGDCSARTSCWSSWRASVGQGDAATIAATVREHVAAGADHVTVGMPIGTDFTTGVDHLEQLAAALLEPT
jgi:alkanesulfonate monooxygenase SsuD/methylene tetrahydromethanopterin reductase-like flavin-dependent oxidoreductase (luciferase family)